MIETETEDRMIEKIIDGLSVTVRQRLGWWQCIITDENQRDVAVRDGFATASVALEWAGIACRQHLEGEPPSEPEPADSPPTEAPDEATEQDIAKLAIDTVELAEAGGCTLPSFAVQRLLIGFDTCECLLSAPRDEMQHAAYGCLAQRLLRLVNAQEDRVSNIGKQAEFAVENDVLDVKEVDEILNLVAQVASQNVRIEAMTGLMCQMIVELGLVDAFVSYCAEVTDGAIVI